MFRAEYLLGLCVVLAAVQSGSAWWWKKQNCPQQEHCPMKCISGYVSDVDQNGCKAQLCRCNNVCEHFVCPGNTECCRKFQWHKWGGHTVYASCCIIYDQFPTQSPVKVVPDMTNRVRTTVPTTASTKPSSTALPATRPTTPRPTTPNGVKTTSASEAITQKTASPTLCPDNQEPLEGWHCNVKLLRGRPCPTNYRCETGSSGGLAVCCPAPVTVRQPSQPTRATQGTPSPSYCSDGKPHLAGLQCGRGGERCPSSHKCVIHPADRYAVCCPIPVPVPHDQPQTQTPLPQQSLPMCEQPVKAGSCKGDMPRWHFNSATGICELFRYTGCNSNANNFSSMKACERSCGAPGQSYCSLPEEVGRCRAAFRRYTYNQTSGECQEFIYGGCEGNGNNFRTVEQCQTFCN